MEFGRGYDIPLPPPGVNLPAISLELDIRPWPAGPDFNSGSSDGQPNRMTQVFLETSKLMIITARITDTMLVFLFSLTLVLTIVLISYCQGPSETFVPEDSTAINLQCAFLPSIHERILIHLQSTTGHLVQQITLRAIDFGPRDHRPSSTRHLDQYLLLANPDVSSSAVLPKEPALGRTTESRFSSVLGPLH